MNATVVVLAGGLSHERDVSLRSGRRVAVALRDAGFEVHEADMNALLIPLLLELQNPVAFPLLHGGVGEDGALREVLELMGVPFVGPMAASCRITFDKAVATPVIRAHGMVTPRQVALPQGVFKELGAGELIKALGDKVGFPMMIKPARSGSALGASKVTSIEQLPAAMVEAYAYGDVNVIEEFIEGTEIAVAVLESDDGAVALPPVEIRPISGVYDYDSRYTAGATRFITPAELDAQTTQACADLAIAAHQALGLRDFSRIDIIVRPNGEPVFIEANVAPGMTETSLVPLAMEAANLDLGEVCGRLVHRAIARMSPDVIDTVPDES